MKRTLTVGLGFICPFCGGYHDVTMPRDVFEKGHALYDEGASIQRAFPTLTPTEREQMLSHICPTCQDKFFKD